MKETSLRRFSNFYMNYFCYASREYNFCYQSAKYAFYLLIMGILWKIIRQLMNNHFEKKNIAAKKDET